MQTPVSGEPGCENQHKEVALLLCKVIREKCVPRRQVSGATFCHLRALWSWRVLWETGDMQSWGCWCQMSSRQEASVVRPVAPGCDPLPGFHGQHQTASVGLHWEGQCCLQR